MSAAIDTPTREDYHPPQQDVAQPILAPTPSGCRDWFVVATKPQAERRAHAALHLKGYQPYLPLITVRLPNRHYRTGPLFPGYLFTRLDLAHPWYPIRYAPGVYSLISTNGIPSPCPQGAVEAIQEAEAARALYPMPKHRWAPGAPCTLASGPFQDCDAVILKVGSEMVLVALMMFGALREVAVQLDALKARED